MAVPWAKASPRGGNQPLDLQPSNLSAVGCSNQSVCLCRHSSSPGVLFTGQRGRKTEANSTNGHTIKAQGQLQSLTNGFSCHCFLSPKLAYHETSTWPEKKRVGSRTEFYLSYSIILSVSWGPEVVFLIQGQHHQNAFFIS